MFVSTNRVEQRKLLLLAIATRCVSSSWRKRHFDSNTLLSGIQQLQIIGTLHFLFEVTMRKT